MAQTPVSRVPIRSGLTILELVVTFSIITLLLTLTVPAVLRARESARDMQCRSRLKNIGLALQAFHETNGSLPAGWQRDSGKRSAYGWASRILPQLEQANVARDIDFAAAVDSMTNQRARERLIPSLLCPSDNALSVFELHVEADAGSAVRRPTNSWNKQPAGDTVPEYGGALRLAASNYVGVFGTFDPDVHPSAASDGAFMQDRVTRFRDFVRGQSQALLVGERTARKLPATWYGVVLRGEDAPARLTGFAFRGPNHPQSDECEFDSRHAGHVNFLFADGHVSAVRDQIDRKVYQTLARRY